jgi:uroporphyrinogen-III synthase
MTQPDLRGLGVLLTRPLVQAQRTAAALRDTGARVFILPALEITPVDSSPQLDAVLARARDADWVVFISANAVEHGLPQIARTGGTGGQTRIAAIGAATRAALVAGGYAEVVMPLAGNDSEALLAHPDLQHVTGQHIIIVRGQSEGGGRRLLGETLSRRGATVHFAECYLRAKPQPDPASLESLLASWKIGEVDAVQVMSVETLENLVSLIAERGLALLCNTCLLAPHRRIAQAAHALGCSDTRVCGLDDAQLIACLAAIKAHKQDIPRNRA